MEEMGESHRGMPLGSRPEDDIIPTCKELGIGVVAYSSLGRGMLTNTVDREKLGESSAILKSARVKGSAGTC